MNNNTLRTSFACGLGPGPEPAEATTTRQGLQRSFDRGTGHSDEDGSPTSEGGLPLTPRGRKTYSIIQPMCAKPALCPIPCSAIFLGEIFHPSLAVPCSPLQSLAVPCSPLHSFHQFFMAYDSWPTWTQGVMVIPASDESHEIAAELHTSACWVDNPNFVSSLKYYGICSQLFSTTSCSKKGRATSQSY